jgi:serine/threonine protein kinase
MFDQNILVSFEAAADLPCDGTSSGGSDADVAAAERRAAAVRVTLVDLGLASAASHANDETGGCSSSDGTGGDALQSPSRLLRVRTPAFSSIGSPAFMAPEQVADAVRADLRSDLYGLGATVYACVTGRLPFDGASPARVMQQVVEGEVCPPSFWQPALPKGVEALILWLMATTPAGRPTECEAGGELVQAIEALKRTPHDVGVVLQAQRQAERRKSRADVWHYLTNAARFLTIAASVVAVGIVLRDLRPSAGSAGDDELHELQTDGSTAGDVLLDAVASSAWQGLRPGRDHI